jgi:phosphoribosylanthranilate isomerase
VPPPVIKICGLSTPETLAAALDAGADLVGFVHFPKSPRHVTLETGRALSNRARGRAIRTALLVNPDDALLAAVVEALDPDLIQLHGSETPERVAAIRARFGRPVMKAVGIAEPSDLTAVAAYAPGADRLLLDAKPPKTAAALPGGNGLAFDWRLLAGLDPATPFMLSGGLSRDNVAEAIALTGARSVDVSSGVESRPGEKDPAKIEAFVKAARAGFAAHQDKATLA